MVALNGDLSVRVAVDTERLAWTASPSRTVWRKRVHLVGPPEAGQVTSVVRYEPGSTFPVHDHPDGEELLVLHGVFSDEHGDWPVGTYLLNPEGFRHAPFSRTGCTLFVKLRQFPGREREHVVIQTAERPWQPTARPGIDARPLYAQPGFADSTRLERWTAGAAPGPVTYPGGAEIFVLDGELQDASWRFGAGTWLRLPAGASHAPASQKGCVLYVKNGGLKYLQHQPDDGPA